MAPDTRFSLNFNLIAPVGSLSMMIFGILRQPFCSVSVHL
jgi:hypothetical protein